MYAVFGDTDTTVCQPALRNVENIYLHGHAATHEDREAGSQQC